MLTLEDRLTSEAANKIFQHAKERVYTIQMLHMQCTWKKNSQMIGVLDDILQKLQLEHVLEPVLGKSILSYPDL